ncbi:MAG: electron transport complex subunit E [Gammaproteobacteria bacterium]|nr:electron transport complex subunit E [Gammaproteobacteria bacterium]
MSDNAKIFREGLWNNNAGLVQLLGLCPLLAVTSTVINGLGLGLATMATLVLSNSVVSMIRHVVRPEIRIPVFVLVIAAIVTSIELAMSAWLHGLYTILGIFIPLIVTNCAIIGRAEAFASKNNVKQAALDGFAMGLGFTLLLVVLGGMRELIGMGTLFSQAHLMFGEAARGMTLHLMGEDYRGFLLAILPPGAFFGMGILIVVKNLIDQRRKDKVSSLATIKVVVEPAQPPATS